jgi:hypothetical protein
MISRPVAVPVMAKLVIKGTASASRLWLARRMVTRLASRLPGREVHVTADSAYAGEELKKLPDGVTWTTRLRSNAALYDLPPERTGKRGRPREGRPAPLAGEDRRHGGVLAGRRHPLRQDRDHRRARLHLPVVASQSMRWSSASPWRSARLQLLANTAHRRERYHVRVPLRHFGASTTEPLTCCLARRDFRLGLGDSLHLPRLSWPP